MPPKRKKGSSEAITEETSLIFCESCGSFMRISEVQGSLLFVCDDCGFQKAPTEGKAVKIFSKSFEETSGFSIDMDNLQLLKEDPINPRVRVRCGKKDCDSEIMIYRRSDHNMNRFFMCPKCGTHWMETI